MVEMLGGLVLPNLYNHPATLVREVGWQLHEKPMRTGPCLVLVLEGRFLSQSPGFYSQGTPPCLVWVERRKAPQTWSQEGQGGLTHEPSSETHRPRRTCLPLPPLSLQPRTKLSIPAGLEDSRCTSSCPGALAFHQSKVQGSSPGESSQLEPGTGLGHILLP